MKNLDRMVKEYAMGAATVLVVIALAGVAAFVSGTSALRALHRQPPAKRAKERVMLSMLLIALGSLALTHVVLQAIGPA